MDLIRVLLFLGFGEAVVDERENELQPPLPRDRERHREREERAVSP